VLHAGHHIKSTSPCFLYLSHSNLQPSWHLALMFCQDILYTIYANELYKCHKLINCLKNLDLPSISLFFITQTDKDSYMYWFLLYFCFQIHHFISMYAKSDKKVYLISFDNTFGHFHAVSLKLGTNLARKRDVKDIFFFDGLKYGYLWSTLFEV